MSSSAGVSTSPGTLYVVATPIGNLEDITLRALRVLAGVDLIAAEDTRQTRKLLAQHGISTPLTSYHRHSGPGKEDRVIVTLRSGKSVALVSDAGTPAISDPGESLVARAAAEGIPLVPVPGPCALIAALAVSGLPSGHFAFDGFLPRTGKNRRRFLAGLVHDRRTLVFYEAPHRVLDTLADLELVLGDRPAVVARELTKTFEEVYRGTLAGARAHFGASPPRGEFTIIVAGATEKNKAPNGRPAAANDQVLS